MTDEELQKEIQNVSESIDNLSKPDDPLSKEERRHRAVLLLKKDILDKIKDAKGKNDKNAELHHSMVYGLLTSWGEKHPYLMSLVQSSFRWNAF